MKKRWVYAFIFTVIITSIIFVSSVNLDLNHDGTINVQDIQALASHYEGKASYNSSFDVNNDSKINLFDLVEVAKGINISTGSITEGNAIPYFYDGFENYSNGSSISGYGGNGFHWDLWQGKPGTPSDGQGKVSTDVAYSGNKSLKLTFLGVAPGYDDYSEQHFELADNASVAPKEIWMDWYVYFPSNFHFRSNETPNNNKLWAMWASTYGAYSDMLADLEYQGKSSVYPHINIISAPNGSLWPTSADHDSNRSQLWANDSSVAGKWHHIQFHLRVGNDAGDNGTMQVWFDSNLVVQSNSDYDMYTSISPANNYWLYGYLMGWANAGFTDNTSFYIDDVKVYNQTPDWGYNFT